MKYLIAVIAIALLTGCTIRGGNVVDEDKNKTMECVDTRDNEKFVFHASTITNPRIGYGVDSSFDVVDTNGTKRTLTESMEAYMKCKEVNQHSTHADKEKR